MATIRTAIQITDGMSPAFRSMNNALRIVLNSFESMQSASHNSIDTASIQAARAELDKAEVSFNQVGTGIKQADAQQQKFTNDIRGGTTAAGGLQSKIMQLVASVGVAFGAKQIIGLSDTMVSTTARLNLMNDGLQTTGELQDKIYASAERARGSYIDTANVVGKLGILAGAAFSGNDEQIYFVEQMNKQFKIGGSSITEQTSAMYQLTQAMASGRLQGDEFRSIMENAPMLAQAISKEMGISVGELRVMSAEGEITAEIIKNALFSAADETNAAFAKLPLTFESLWVSFKNKTIKAFEPVLAKISQIANDAQFQNMVNSFVGGLVLVANTALTVFAIIATAGQWFYDNWSILEPIIIGLVAAFLIYNGIALITSVINGITAFSAGVAAAALLLQSGATFAATVAQTGLNAAIYACPITWIILAIILVIVIFYAVVAAINTFAGTSVSATGIIFGAFAALGAGLYDIFLAVLDIVLGVFNGIMQVLVTVVNFLANCFVSPISSVIYLFQGLADAVLSVLEGIAGAMDDLFGTNLAASVSSWRTSLKGMADDLAASTGETYTAAVKWDEISTDTLGLQPIKMMDAYNAGYGVGDSVQKTVTSFDPSTLLSGATEGLTMPKPDPYTPGIEKNTGSMADSMVASEEDLKYLRDLAEQDIVNRFTTAEIQVNLGGVNNNVSTGTDLDGVVSYLEEKLYQTMEIAAEGVHS